MHEEVTATSYFKYGEDELDHLRARDKKLAWAIDQIGHINRPVIDDLFEVVIDSILGQQISTQAHKTIRARLKAQINELTPENVIAFGRENLQKLGITFRKADYILGFSEKVASGEFDIDGLELMDDESIIKTLCELDGIGVWTAEMLMTFCLQRPNIVSYGDLAILRGMRMLYRHRKIDRQKFDRYRKRYSPYGSIASLYLWAISAGAIPELTDPAPKN